MSQPFLAIDNLVKSYGEQPAVRGVSFEVRQGELFGLLGPNGAGKTTIMSILACVLNATSGSTTLVDQRLHTGNREVRRLIGLVPQELAIYN